jgi:hypothetical protein
MFQIRIRGKELQTNITKTIKYAVEFNDGLGHGPVKRLQVHAESEFLQNSGAALREIFSQNTTLELVEDTKPDSTWGDSWDNNGWSN